MRPCPPGCTWTFTERTSSSPPPWASPRSWRRAAVPSFPQQLSLSAHFPRAPPPSRGAHRSSPQPDTHRRNAQLVSGGRGGLRFPVQRRDCRRRRSGPDGDAELGARADGVRRAQRGAFLMPCVCVHAAFATDAHASFVRAAAAAAAERPLLSLHPAALADAEAAEAGHRFHAGSPVVLERLVREHQIVDALRALPAPPPPAGTMGLASLHSAE